MSHENRQYEKSFQGVKNKTDGKKVQLLYMPLSSLLSLNCTEEGST